jgi:hypothetical protein
MIIPFTFSTPPRNLNEYQFGNNFAACSMYLDLNEDIITAVTLASKAANELKNSFIVPGFYFLIWFYNAFTPMKYVEFVYNSSGRKHTLLCSNIPGFLKPVHIRGNLGKRFIILGSGSGNCATSINLISVNKRI